ncbi:MAG: hypothetical protein JSR39_05610 [Verrucomicrobia bacterium]|nr:hypothetical protein [Verrucomicrobiota bacterium]
MSQAAQPTASQYAANTAIQAGVNGALGAFAAAAFTTINPFAGAIFGVTSTFGTHVINWIMDKTGIAEDSSAGKIIKFAVSFFGGIAIGALAATAAGFPITFVGGLILTVCMLGTTFAVSLLLGACATSAVAATGLALDSSELREELARAQQQGARV